jgi:hypothetical protein
MTYKALRYTSGEWVVIFDDFGPSEILTTGIPALMSEDTTMEILRGFYDQIDFSGIELVTLEINVRP